MQKLPRRLKRLSPVGEVIEKHFRLTNYKTYTEFAFYARRSPGQLSRMMSGSRPELTSKALPGVCVALARGKVVRGTCNPEEFTEEIGRIKREIQATADALLDLGKLADEHLAGLAEEWREQQRIASATRNQQKRAVEEKREEEKIRRSRAQTPNQKTVRPRKAVPNQQDEDMRPTAD